MGESQVHICSLSLRLELLSLLLRHELERCVDLGHGRVHEDSVKHAVQERNIVGESLHFLAYVGLHELPFDCIRVRELGGLVIDHHKVFFNLCESVLQRVVRVLFETGCLRLRKSLKELLELRLKVDLRDALHDPETIVVVGYQALTQIMRFL